MNKQENKPTKKRIGEILGTWKNEKQKKLMNEQIDKWIEQNNFKKY